MEGLPCSQKIHPRYSDDQLGIRIPAPSFNEACSRINKLKNGKAGGTDNIIPELIKYGGRVLKQRICINNNDLGGRTVAQSME
jgi:hypothetical protein